MRRGRMESPKDADQIGSQNQRWVAIGANPIPSGSPSTSHCQSTCTHTHKWWDRKRTADRLWLYELLGALGSLACFAALVAVLRRSEGKEQSRWLYNKLTLNGLIALLSTFIRASMMFSVGACLSQMKWNHFSSQSSQGSSGRRLEDLNTFDEASRGPFGSLKLLFAWTRPYVQRAVLLEPFECMNYEQLR